MSRTAGHGRQQMAGTTENERQLIGPINLYDGFMAPRSGVWLAWVDPSAKFERSDSKGG